MQALDRRDCIKQGLTLTFLSAAGFPLPVFGGQAEGNSQAKSEAKQEAKSHLSSEEFWKQVEQAKGGALAHGAINAARAAVLAQREVNASKRASILLGGEAGKDQMARAEKHHETRTAELQKTKKALAEFLRSAGDSGETRFKEFLGKGGLKETLEHARKSTIQTLLKSDISADEARTALKALDDRLGKVQEMTSFKDLAGHLDQHLDDLIGQKMSQEDPNPLCVFVLLITSVYLILLIISILICVLLLGLVPCDQIFNQMIAQACP